MSATKPYKNRETREIGRGEGLSLQFTVYSDQAHTTFYDISSGTIIITFALAKKSSDTAMITKTSAVITEIEKTDPTNGVFVVKLANTDTSALDVGSYRFDAVLSDSSTSPATKKIISRGDIVIIEGVAI